MRVLAVHDPVRSAERVEHLLAGPELEATSQCLALLVVARLRWQRERALLRNRQDRTRQACAGGMRGKSSRNARISADSTSFRTGSRVDAALGGASTSSRRAATAPRAAGHFSRGLSLLASDGRWRTHSALVDDREHPLRRRYALEVALGLVLIAVAAWVLLRGGGDEPSETPPAQQPAAAGR